MSKVSVRPFLNTAIQPKQFEDFEGEDFYPIYFQVIHKRITSKLKAQGFLRKEDPIIFTPELEKEAKKIKAMIKILENNIADFNLRNSSPTLGNWNNLFNSCLYVILKQTSFFHYTEILNLKKEVVKGMSDIFKKELKQNDISPNIFEQIIQIDPYIVSCVYELFHFVKEENNVYTIKKMDFANFIFTNFEKYSLLGFLTDKGIVKKASQESFLDENTLKEFVLITNEHLKKAINKYYKNSKSLKSDMEFWGESED